MTTTDLPAPEAMIVASAEVTHEVVVGANNARGSDRGLPLSWFGLSAFAVSTFVVSSFRLRGFHVRGVLFPPSRFPRSWFVALHSSHLGIEYFVQLKHP